ncbi:hypothetical protein VCHA47P369_20303 [Vibrio chagasii]|nr:hypothetical protein VCHA27O13_160042 [Vibrio chagasii]CAH6799758.1 hypothetical protein VCHA34P114_110046 [Vibrio chagasii]CAH6799808.1 hypothetical protein VCHA34P115_110044 [Vibrio chagasii]CAH6824084.1 hypothetical protein VCHA35O141_160081 [Vibrio chagasii]CAH6830108.1 hypothetical protein VCHA35O135_170045 [Vibrio chagasii]
MSVSSQSFEQLLMNQSETLINSDPKDFTATWATASFDVLDWFDIDRLTFTQTLWYCSKMGKQSRYLNHIFHLSINKTF